MPDAPTVTIPAPGLATRVSGSHDAAPTVALLHGFTQTGHSWGAVAAALTGHGHRVVTVDMPGHGGSGDVRADLPGSGDLVTVAAGPAIYVGYSMGGRVALHAALRSPSAVRGLVLIGATAGITDDAERTARRDADERLAAELERDGVDAFLVRWLTNPLFATLPAAAAGLADRRANTVAGLAASLRQCGTGTQEPLWERLGSIDVPVAIVAGALDEKFCAIGVRLAEAIGANATFTTIPDAGHAAHLEQPEAVIAATIATIATSATIDPS